MAASMDEFNFIEYLRDLDPHVSYTVHPVSGGVVNLTARVKKDGANVDKGKFAGHSSMLLKHAPPYIAKLGKGAPFSESRQIVEAQALTLLGAPPPTGLRDIAMNSTVTVPELLYHDPKHHVLVLADLGTHSDLSEIFSDLGGSHPKLEPVPQRHIHFGNHKLSTESVAYFQDIGTRLGAFFSQLHDSHTKERISNRSDFDNPEARSIALSHSVQPAIRRVLELFGPELKTKAESLKDVIEEDASREKMEEELSFTLGDCWPSAVLVSVPETEQAPLVGVIDWEFAHFGPGLHGDMAQLMAHLEMLRISAKQHPKFSSHREALNELIGALVSSYRSHGGVRLSSDTIPPIEMRSALITCGVEMINCAVWKKWVCADSGCTQNHSAQISTPDCPVVTRITNEGIKLVELACENIQAFQNSESQDELAAMSTSERKSGEKWLADLF